MLLQDLKLCWLPFQTHDSEVENGGDCQHVLHVVNKLAHESTKSPRKGKQFGQLKKNINSYFILCLTLSHFISFFAGAP